MRRLSIDSPEYAVTPVVSWIRWISAGAPELGRRRHGDPHWRRWACLAAVDFCVSCAVIAGFTSVLGVSVVHRRKRSRRGLLSHGELLFHLWC